ncbi:MAG: tandem-95 repeat protein, partial [Pseudomonadota bacterium]
AIDEDGNITLSWIDPEYLYEYIEVVDGGGWSETTSSSHSWSFTPTETRQTVEVGVRVCNSANCNFDDWNEHVFPVIVKETMAPRPVDGVDLSGMSSFDPLVDDDGSFSASWEAPAGSTIDSFRWRLHEKQADGTWLQLQTASNLDTSVSFSGLQQAADRELRISVWGENLRGLGDVVRQAFTVRGSDLSQHSPVATEAEFFGLEEQALAIDLSAFASDPQGDALEADIQSVAPTAGTMTGTGLLYTFTPADDFNTEAIGPVSLSYTVSDGVLTSEPSTILINIAAVNDAPVATDETVYAVEGQTTEFQLGATDVDSLQSGLSWHVDQFDGGTLDTSALPTVRYTAGTPGVYTLVFTVTDAGGLSDSAEISVIVSVDADHAPAGIDPTKHRSIAGDFDGDGNTDFALQPIEATQNPYLLFSASSSGDAHATVNLKELAPFSDWTWPQSQVVTGDTNGSGRDDVLVFTPDEFILIRSEVPLADFEGHLNQRDPWAPLNIPGVPADYRIHMVDLNGDGQDDLVFEPLVVVAPIDRIHVIYSDYLGRYRPWQVNELVVDLLPGDDFLLGDLNGDLATDLITHRRSTGAVKVMLTDFANGYARIPLEFPAGAFGFDLDLANSTFSTANWSRRGFTDLLIEEVVASTSAGRAHDIRYRAMRTLVIRDSDELPTLNQCALQGMSFGVHNAGLHACTEYVDSAKVPIGVFEPVVELSTDSNGLCQMGPDFSGCATSVTAKDLDGHAGFCLFRDADLIGCGTSMNVLLEGIPMGGAVVTMRATASPTSPVIRRVEITHPDGMPSPLPPAEVEFVNATREQFAPLRTQIDDVRLCWVDRNDDATREQVVWRRNASGVFEQVAAQPDAPTAEPFGSGFQYRYCLTDQPRSGGGFGSDAFNTQYKLQSCDGGVCSDESLSGEIRVIPPDFLANMYLRNPSFSASTPPMTRNNRVDVRWDDPSYSVHEYLVETNGQTYTVTDNRFDFDYPSSLARTFYPITITACTAPGVCLESSRTRFGARIRRANQRGRQPAAIILKGTRGPGAVVDDDGKVSVSWTESEMPTDHYAVWLQEKQPNGSWQGIQGTPETAMGREFSVGKSANFREMRVELWPRKGTLGNAAQYRYFNVEGTADAPVPVDLVEYGPEDQPVYIDFSRAVSDPLGEPVSIQILTALDPAIGTITGTGTDFTFTAGPDSNAESALIRIEYTASNSVNTSAKKNLVIDLLPVNNAPEAADLAVTMDEDTSTTFVLPGSDADNDPGSLIYEILSYDGNPILEVAGLPTVGFTPEADRTGVATLTYQVTDPWGLSATGTVSITINPINDAPTASSQTVSLVEDSVAFSFDLSAADVDGDTLSVEIIDGPDAGTCDCGGVSATYTPDPDFSGTDSLTYRVSDGVLSSETATVTFEIAGANDGPLATDKSVTAFMDESTEIVLEGTDVDSPILLFENVVLDDPVNGTLDTSNLPTVVFTPAPGYLGDFVLSFTVTDGEFNDAGQVSITMDEVNDPPVAVFKVYENVVEDGGYQTIVL